jgi:hypothetical protein
MEVKAHSCSSIEAARSSSNGSLVDSTQKISSLAPSIQVPLSWD